MFQPVMLQIVQQATVGQTSQKKKENKKLEAKIFYFISFRSFFKSVSISPKLRNSFDCHI
jgi:hypothetical protein